MLLRLRRQILSKFKWEYFFHKFMNRNFPIQNSIVSLAIHLKLQNPLIYITHVKSTIVLITKPVKQSAHRPLSISQSHQSTLTFCTSILLYLIEFIYLVWNLYESYEILWYFNRKMEKNFLYVVHEQTIDLDFYWNISEKFTLQKKCAKNFSFDTLLGNFLLVFSGDNGVWFADFWYLLLKVPFCSYWLKNWIQFAFGSYKFIQFLIFLEFALNLLIFLNSL